MHAREDMRQGIGQTQNHVRAVREVTGTLPAERIQPDRAWAGALARDPEPCASPGEPLTFDGLLAGIWADATVSRPQLRACAVPGPLDGELWRYAQAFSALLGVRPTRMTAEEGADALFSTSNLIILGGDCHALIRRALSRASTDAERALGPAAPPVAVLAAQKPRWPLERILLVLSGETGDHAAVDWALRLAGPAVADVTVLAVVPPVPAMYQGLSRMEQTLRSLLRTDTPLGNQMREAGARLVEAGIESRLRLRQGTPEHQVCREVAERAHDLIIMATNPCRWWLRRLKGDPVCWLLSRIDRPLLFVEPTTG